MKNTQSSADEYRIDDQIDLVQLWSFFWKEKVVIMSITLLFTLASIVYALLQTNIYRAETVLAPVEEESRSNSSIAGLGLASNLAGISINQSVTRTQNAIAILQSRAFLNQVISEYDLLPYLLASKWNSTENRNVIDEQVYDPETQSWLNSVPGYRPSDWAAYKALDRILEVNEDRQNGLIRVSIEWSDPLQAASWVNLLVEEINQKIKEQDLSEANGAIEFLTKQLSVTSLVEMQRILYQLIESQTRIVMLADVRDEYMFEVIDPAIPPEDIVRPNRLLICLFGALLGLISALVLVSFRDRSSGFLGSS